MRGAQIGHRVPVDIPLVGTVRDTVDALLPLLTRKTDAAHLNRMTAHYRRARKRLDHLAGSGPDRSPLHPQFIAATIDRLAADDAVFTADVGSPCIWAARYLRMNGRRRMIGSFNHGSMANALPQAIGAQAAQPGRAAFAHDGPALVDVRSDRYELALPPKISFGQLKGFTLYATRTVLSGEGRELVELTKSNVRDLEVE